MITGTNFGPVVGLRIGVGAFVVVSSSGTFSVVGLVVRLLPIGLIVDLVFGRGALTVVKLRSGIEVVEVTCTADSSTLVSTY